MKCRSLFSGKKKKKRKLSPICHHEVTQRVVRVYMLSCTINLYHSLGIFSRRQNDVIVLIFPRKQDLTFHANCLLRRQFA